MIDWERALMGSRGPVGKRAAERMGHRTKAEKAQTDTVEIVGEVEVPEPDPGWHPVAADWYKSLAESGQSRFFEPSDWRAAFYVAEVMTKNLTASRFSSELFKGVWAAMNDLLSTEGSRRRVRLEIERQGEPGEVMDLGEIRRRLAEGG